MNKVATRSSTKEKVSTNSRRRKKNSRSSRKSRKEPDSESDSPVTARVPVGAIPTVELEKGVEPSRIDRDISQEVRQQLVDPGDTPSLRKVRFDDQPVIFQPDPKIRVDEYDILQDI